MFQLFVAIIFIVVLARYLTKFGAFLSEYIYKQRLTRGMAGPENLPLIGCIHKAPMDSHLLLQWLVDESHKAINAGHSVMCAWVGPKLIITPLDGEATRAITNSNTEINKGEDYEFFKQWLGPALLLGTGERWFKTRKLLTPAFHFAKVEEYCEAMDYHARTMIEMINRMDTRHEINLYDYIKLCSLDILADATMGIRLNAQEDSSQPYVKAVEKFTYLGYLRSQRPLYFMFNGFFWWLLGYDQQTQETLKTLKTFTQEVIRKRSELYNEIRADQYEHVEKKRLNFLDLMLQLQSEDQMTVEDLREETDTFMFAGHDTTSHAVSWAIWALATHPQIQERLYREIVDTFGESDTEFATAKIKDLKYLDACFKEVVRVRAPVPVVQRLLTNEMEMGGRTIPKNTTINLFPYILHHNPKVFSNPEIFDPERFTEGKDYPPGSYIPFSAGPRNCIGQKFAQRVAKILITHLVFNFEFSTPLQFLDNKPRAEVVTKPDLGVPVKIRPRHH
ncbi:hypothetical protein M3Y97_00662600 [Aphelenchoides bicaudatus]|nr:hypothetical protein M3Y97_00662600 [Aphelenchoides bicaudatus]